jgi:segregation and condensation protein A
MEAELLEYKIKIDVFSGPFDLLLDLILKQEVDVCEVPIATITDDYLRHLSKMEELNLDLTSEFLVIAATLLELKSYALLPIEEDEAIEMIRSEVETRDSLIEHLVDYMTFQSVTQDLAGKAEAQSFLFARVAQPEEDLAELTPDFLAGIRLPDLTSLALELLRPKAMFTVDTSHMAIYNVSITEKAHSIVDKLKKTKTRTFRELCGSAETKIEKIVVFLAMLELFKRGVVGVSQARLFGDIKISLLDEKNLDWNQWADE